MGSADRQIEERWEWQDAKASGSTTSSFGRWKEQHELEAERFAPLPPDGYVRWLSQVCPQAADWLQENGFTPTSPWRATKFSYDPDEDYECTLSSISLEWRDERYVLVARRTGEGEVPDLLPDAGTCSAITGAAAVLRKGGKFPSECKVPSAKLRETLPPDLQEHFDDGRVMADFADRNGMIGYLQVRNPDRSVTGRGKYHSYVHYDGGVGWIFGQPEKLPLGGQDRLSAETRRVFICEGPKAMAGARRQMAEKPDHPWTKALSGAVITCWPGGGDRHWNVDWSPLDALPPSCEIVVVEDNDDVGRGAARFIAERHLWDFRHVHLAEHAQRDARRSDRVRVLEFPSHFERGFDLADPWPEASGAPDLLGLAHLRPYIGNAKASQMTGPTDEVCLRLSERGLAFQIAGEVVLIGRQKSAFLRDPSDPEPDPRKKRPAETYHAVIAKEAQVVRPVEKVSRWESFDRRQRGDDSEEGQWVSAQVPPWLTKQVVGNPGLLNTLAGIVDYPLISSGKLLTGDLGYDSFSGLFINSPSVEIEEWPDPQAALRFLLGEWLAPFPFRNKGDALRALAVPLQLLLRPTDIREGGAPFPFCTAPEPKTGKSLLMRMLCFVVLGYQPPSAVFAKEEEELRKQFVGALMEAPPVVFYDNVPNKWRVGTAFLDQYATEAAEYSFRVLGTNKNLVVPALPMVAFLGNNIEASGDTETRAYEIRLEKKEQQHPDLERVPEFTRQNRRKILGALLSISRVAPLRLPGVRFPDWVRLVGGPLAAVAGAPDLFTEMANATGEPAEEAEGLQEALCEIGRVASAHRGRATCSQMLADERCSEALHSMFRLDPGRLSVKTLGPKLRGYRDKQAGGLRLRVQKGEGKSPSVYFVEGELPM